jgi:hypothetical protein
MANIFFEFYCSFFQDFPVIASSLDNVEGFSLALSHNFNSHWEGV